MFELAASVPACPDDLDLSGADRDGPRIETIVGAEAGDAGLTYRVWSNGNTSARNFCVVVSRDADGRADLTLVRLRPDRSRGFRVMRIDVTVAWERLGGQEPTSLRLANPILP